MHDTYSVPSFDRFLDSVLLLVTHAFNSTYLSNAWSCSIICFGSTCANMAANSTLERNQLIKIEIIFGSWGGRKTRPKSQVMSMGTLLYSQKSILLGMKCTSGQHGEPMLIKRTQARYRFFSGECWSSSEETFFCFRSNTETGLKNQRIYMLLSYSTVQSYNMPSMHCRHFFM